MRNATAFWDKIFTLIIALKSLCVTLLIISTSSTAREKNCESLNYLDPAPTYICDFTKKGTKIRGILNGSQ